MITVNRRDSLDWFEGMTVSTLLERMGYDFTLLTVTVNDSFIPIEDYDEFTVPDNADVRVIHLHHGG